MMAMKSDRNGRCDSVFAHSERLISVPHWHTDFVYKKMKKNMLPRWNQNKGNEIIKQNINLSCQTKRRQTIMTDVANQFVCLTLILTPHSHIDLFVLAKSMGNTNDISHTHKQLHRECHQFHMFDHSF